MYEVWCIGDEADVYVRASRVDFPALGIAQAYAKTIAPSRKAYVIPTALVESIRNTKVSR